MKIKTSFVLFVVIIFFFVVVSFRNMVTLPFSEFDEANRAEGARNMVKFSYLWAPVTGSPFFRRDDLSIEYDKNSNVYIHFERNPLVFWTMGLSSKIFGDKEISYRLPSFLFGIGTVAYLFKILSKKSYLLALISILPILFSYDWWMSCQMAHLDTALTFFLTLALVLLINEKNGNNWWLISISIWLAFLSKGQMLVFLMTPLLLALVFKKINLETLIKISLLSLVLIIISLIPVFINHGFRLWFDNYVLELLQNRAVNNDVSQVAPMWWYGYWWLFSFRWGVFLFVPLVIYDFVSKKIDKGKIIILAYIAINFILMSYMKNKVWWYVMPLMPGVCVYIYKSLMGIKRQGKFKNILLVIFISSLPLFWGIEISLKRVVAYSVLIIFINSLVLIKNFKVKNFEKWLFVPIILLSAIIFYKKFPKPSASFPEVKRLLTGIDLSQVCLFVESMPYEGVMYYSEAGEINYWQTKVKENCQNYLVSPNYFEFEKIKEIDRLKLYKINAI